LNNDRNSEMKRIVALLMLVALVAMGMSAALANDNTVTYTGQGFSNGMLETEKCDPVDLGQDKDFIVGPDGGYLKWILTASGAESATITGPWGTFDMIQAGGGAFHKATDYYPVDDLIAFPVTASWVGDVSGNIQLTVSNGCQGAFESLDVSKTAVTSFEREHFWDIEKKVETENEEFVNGTPKIWLYTDGSGDETATWTVDVTYEGYEDSAHNVSGTITITNTGTLDAVITDISDKLAGEDISIEPDIVLPQTLAVGQSLNFSYSENVDGKVEGDNVVTVTSERDVYSATEPIDWDDALINEINRYVEVTDTNAGFALAHGDPENENKVILDAHDYEKDEVIPFTYSEDFAYDDFVECGSFTYENIGKVIGDDELVLAEADATLKVNVQCLVFDGETAWAATGEVPLQLRYTNRGNWATYVQYAPKTTTLFAGQTMPVGNVTFGSADDGLVTITVNLNDGWEFEDVAENLKIQDYATAPSGNPAPGLFAHRKTCDATSNTCSIEVPANNFYGVHVNVGQWVPDPDFGP
jgi:hypothetical protein